MAEGLYCLLWWRLSFEEYVCSGIAAVQLLRCHRKYKLAYLNTDTRINAQFLFASARNITKNVKIIFRFCSKSMLSQLFSTCILPTNECAHQGLG